MNDNINVINVDGKEIKIDIIMQFRIEEVNKEYVVYTINNDNEIDNAYISISEIEYIDDKYNLKLIPENEKNMVLIFYDNIRDTICNNR